MTGAAENGARPLLLDAAFDIAVAPYLAEVRDRLAAVLADAGGEDDVTRAVARLATTGALPASDARRLMERLTAGEITDDALAGALLVSTAPERLAGETLAGFAEVMRARSHRIAVAAGATVVDTCGTGGDTFKTFNVSTAAAFVLASDGLVVAKHGNRGITSACGSADVLAALGVSIEATPDQARELLERVGIAFLFAPRFHPAMRHVQPLRQRLAAEARAVGLHLPTAFNVLGPITNPAGATHQVIGVMSRAVLAPVAEALSALGTHHALVVCGDGPDGTILDEASPFGATHAFEVRAGLAPRALRLEPAALGLEPVAAAEVRAPADAHAAATLIRAVLAGEPGSAAELVALNAGLALWVAGRAPDAARGIQRARELLSSGRALAVLEDLATASRALAAETRP